jgi:hypothetical protein
LSTNQSNRKITAYWPVIGLNRHVPRPSVRWLLPATPNTPDAPPGGKRGRSYTVPPAWKNR